MSGYQKLSLLTLFWCFCVVVIGAYVRLSDAGLGCPDWPGCYGHLTVPQAQADVLTAQQRFPERPVEAHKAWKEMVHRYLAGGLGLLILALSILGFRQPSPRPPRWLLLGLPALVVFQAILGMWTVTWQLKPAVVTAHLLGGMATLALLALLNLRLWLRRIQPPRLLFAARRCRMLAMLALCVLIAQIFLGGWTSTNYAALACPDLPTCQGQWVPETDFSEAFTLWRGLGINYEFGVLDNRARVTIHWMHRLGAVVVSAMMILLGLVLLRSSRNLLRVCGALVLGALAMQISIGLLVVYLQLPLLLAAAHNAGAAMLLLAVIAANVAITHQPLRAAA